ncbi:MAG TPA: hypothetical protein VLJ21_03515, partial [Candidatus Binatia bacterium]|nr:hypothetical protein [Candidatus Binatia bacterium]
MSAEPPLPALMTLLPRRRFAFLHPLLLSLYIPLFLFAHNFYQVYPSELLLPSVLFLSVGLIVFLIMRLIVGNWPKSAVLSTVVLFFLFFYGIILTEDTRKIITGVLSGHALLSLLVALLAVLASGIALFRWMRAHQGHTLRTLLRTHKGMLVFLVCSAIGVVGLRAFLASQDLPALASKSPIHTFHLVPLSIWLVLGVCCIYAFARIKNDVAV